ncbi:MAG: phosphatidylserine decarboxylase [Rickettsiales bacterium]
MQELIQGIIQYFTFPIHPAGKIFILIFAAVTLVLFAFSNVLGVIGVVLTIWCVFFFRDPVRIVPEREGLVVSPADGVVSFVGQGNPPATLGLEGNFTRVSIFLNVFNVHVNRIPIAGTVTKLHYNKGLFLNASNEKASDDNERQEIALKSTGGKDFAVVQIAGLIARRILCTLNEGQVVETGERLGIIRFGSRVDIYLPEGVDPLVIEGQTMIGGETIIADVQAIEAARDGKKI